MIEMRKLEKGDEQEILRLESEFPPKNRKPLTEEEVEKFYKENPDTCLVAVEDDKIIGFVLSELKDDSCIIRYAYISLERMGEGVLSKLFEVLVDQTKCKRIIKG